MPPKIAVLTGPTATGKTALGVALASALNGEIVGADSMQLYRYMDIGTAKPTKEEQQGIPHHMIDCVSPQENYSVSRYVEDASRVIDDILSRGKLPILVGGTNLYIDSLLSGRSFAPEGSSTGLRQTLAREWAERGGEAMLEELRQVDPESANRLHLHDQKRILRALEIYRATGRTKSAWDRETQLLPPRYEAGILALTFENRQDLYDRIDHRVDQMMERGLQREVSALLSRGLDPDSTAMQAIGYKEMVSALRGECSVSEAADRIRQSSRQYAKRQLSWLRRNGSLHWISWQKNPDLQFGLQDSTEFLKASGVL